MAKVEQPMFILPKKRSGKKQGAITGHVDHIISVQGAECDVPSKYKNGLSPVSEHVVNGIIHQTMEGLKSNMKINLPIITDVNDEEANDNMTIECSQKPQNIKKNGYQPLSTIHNSREVIDLSPIYENSSDACSSHDDLRESNDNDLQKSCKILNSDHCESSSATPNSLSQTQSEHSFEMGPLMDSLKNSAKRKKRVNIMPEVTQTGTIDSEINTFRGSEGSISPDSSLVDTKNGYLTMTGTIKRGKKKGQNVDVKLNISREELEIIEAAIVSEEYNKMDISKCSLYSGPHILMFGLVCMPFIMAVSAMYSFYMGTMTWYNIFTHVTENLSCAKKMFLSPLVILLYPFLISVFTIGLGLYAGVVQLTSNGFCWWKEVCDFEKGFYGWLCNLLGVSECSPYEVVILMDVKP